MMRPIFLTLVVLASCTKAGPGHDTPPAVTTPSPAVAPPPATVTAATDVQLIAVTLADDCGGAPPWSAPPSPSAKREEKADNMDGARAKAKRRCEQTSMQLAITAGAASGIHVKSVELFDAAGGGSLGTLAASKPTRWSDASSTYETWDETVAAGATSSVSYVLEQPKWDQIGNRWNRMYTLKVTLSVGGVDRAMQKDITLTAPTSLPPNVKT